MAVANQSARVQGESETARRLRISEIFHSLQGESDSVGWPTVFVRLTGCPLRCSWCDTAYAFHGGQWLGIDEIVEKVAAHAARHETRHAYGRLAA